MRTILAEIYVCSLIQINVRLPMLTIITKRGVVRDENIGRRIQEKSDRRYLTMRACNYNSFHCTDGA
jgi:hypothetical protein